MEERVQFRPDAETDPQSIPFGEANPLRTGPARDNLSEKTMFQGVTMDAISIIAEQRIREACERGAFDSLPGAGKPLELEDDSHIPEDLRMAYKLLKNAGYVPEEVLDRKEAQSIVDAKWSLPASRPAIPTRPFSATAARTMSGWSAGLP